MRILSIACLLAASAFALVGCKPGDNATQNTNAQTPSAGVAPIPVDVTVAGYDALEAAVNERKGNVVLVDFWATWCGPCKKKFPHFVETHRKYREKGLASISASLDEAKLKEEALKFLKEKGATFPNFIVADYKEESADAKLTKRFGLEGFIPHMVLFDKTGERVWTSAEWAEKEWADDEARFNAELDKLIESELAK